LGYANLSTGPHLRATSDKESPTSVFEQGGTAVAVTGALTGPALLEYAKAWAQASPWKPEASAKLTVMRWKRFVPAEDDAFMVMVAAYQNANNVQVTVFSESFEDIQPKEGPIWYGVCIPCRSYSRTRLSR